MKKIIFLVVMLLTLLGIGACGGSPKTTTAQNYIVHMVGVSFDVSSISISKGSTLTFESAQGSAPHNLVNGMDGLSHSESGVPDFGSGGQTVSPGSSWTTSPWNTAGTFHVTCTYHPTTMTLTVVVTS
jgi:plastocyanin